MHYFANPAIVLPNRRCNTNIRTGATFPIDDLGDINLDPGFGFEGTVMFRINSSLSAYAGWGWHQFGADTPSGSPDVEQTGYVFGFQATRALTNKPFALRARGGITYEHIEIEINRGDIIEDTDHGAGFELGAVVVYSISNWLHVTPVFVIVSYHEMSISEQPITASI